MGEQITKNQHFVPCFYLKAFTDKNGNLCVYDRRQDKFFSCKIENICCEKFLYETPWENANSQLGKYILTNSIEKQFAECEGAYSSLIKKIIKTCQSPFNENALICNKQEKIMLADFVANMLVRNPYILNQENLDLVVSETMECSEIQEMDWILKKMGWNGIGSLIKKAYKNTLLVNKSEESTIGVIIKELCSLNFTFLISDTQNFVTSNFPVVVETYDTEDEITHIKQAYLPLQPHVALLYSKNENIRPYRNKITHITKVQKFNEFYSQIDCEQVRVIISDQNYKE